jgi:hypothetical protein
MKLDVTRDVINDLWPLCRSGDASADSRKLVDAFLLKDNAFASVLEEGGKLSRAMPALQLSPDAERRLLDDARQRARMKLILIGGAVALVGLLAIVALGGVLLIMTEF